MMVGKHGVQTFKGVVVVVVVVVLYLNISYKHLIYKLGEHSQNNNEWSKIFLT